MAIPAYIERAANAGGNLRSPRRALRLHLQGTKATGTGIKVLVHNISASGLLLESDIELAPGDRIEVGLPHAGATWARVIWASARIHGCQFDTPITSATLSAAQLRGAVGPGTASAASDEEAAPHESLGVRLHRLRVARGLTQAQVAAQLSVSEPSISAWEQDKARPKAGRMEALSVLLGVDISELLGIDEAESLSDVVARAKKQIAKAAEISPDNVKIVIEI